MQLHSKITTKFIFLKIVHAYTCMYEYYEFTQFMHTPAQTHTHWYKPVTHKHTQVSLT